MKTARGIYSVAVCFLIFTLLPLSGDVGIAADSDEYRVKLAFIFNYARFTEWPPETFPNATSSLVLCVLGNDPFKSKLDTVQDKMIGERSFIVKEIRRAEDARGCHMLFISGSEKDRVDPILRTVKGLSILTVSDIPNFTKLGGMIGFTFSDDKIRFEINLAVARSSNLEISSKLLKLAESVREDHQ